MSDLAAHTIHKGATMTRKLTFLLLGILLGGTLVFLMGCDQNSFEFETYIEPELTLVSGNIAVEYKLGDLLILDEWPDLNAGQAIFLLNNEKEKTFKLRVTAGDFNGVRFHYEMTGAIELQTKPVDFKILARNVNSFPNVKWITKDGKDIPKEEQKTLANEESKKEPKKEKLKDSL
jgi:hypothetical protein